MILKHDATHGVQFVDFDRDGQLDLALTNNDPDGGGHPLLRNTAAMRGRSIEVEVTDPNARRTRAGSEVRAFRAGTRELLSAALVDSGSGYCSQNEMPVHLGINESWKGRIDIEVTTIAGGLRRVSLVRNIDPEPIAADRFASLPPTDWRLTASCGGARTSALPRTARTCIPAAACSARGGDRAAS